MAQQSRDLRARALQIAGALHAELHRGVFDPDRFDLASSLEHDWGFDSLTRAELLLRLERDLSVRLPEGLLGSAENLQDVLRVVKGPGVARAGPAARQAAILPPVQEAPEPARARTLIEVLDWHADRHGKRVHVVHCAGDGSEATFTYGDLRSRSQAVAHGLRESGLAPGERVALMLPTGMEFFVAFFGILYAGGVPVPIYPPSRPSQIEEHLRRQAGILQNAEAVYLLAPDEGSRIAGILRLQVDCLRAVMKVGELEGPGTSLPVSDPSALALVQYTSGSTGDPKGVALSHANLLANIRAMGQAMQADSKDVFVSWLPLYHDMGLIGAWLGSLYFAARLVIMSPLVFLVRPAEWLWAIHRHRGTLTAAPNFAFELCVRKILDSDIEGLELGSLRMAANGAEAVNPDTIRRFSERFAPRGFRPQAMAPVYGLAENAVGLAFPPLSRLPLIDRVHRSQLEEAGRAVPAGPDDAGTVEFVGCGHALPGHEIRIIDESGEAPDRKEGRLQFRGPSATSGYINHPAKTRELFDGPWLNSGDLAYSVAGEIFVTGRTKDIIIRAGRHLYPEEIERVAGEVAGIRKGCVAAFAVKDPTRGTETIIIMAETRETDPVELRALRARVSAAAGDILDAPPEDVVLVAPHVVPKTSSGKLRRAAARDLYLTGRLRPQAVPVWRQSLHLGVASILPQCRRALRFSASLLFAARWWGAIVLVGAIAWPAVVMTPGLKRRWVLLGRLARFALKTAGTPVRVSGLERIRPPCVIASTHASYADGLVLAAALPGPLAFLAKQELSTQWVAGPFLRALGTIFVTRDVAIEAMDDVGRARQAAEQGATLVVFPEGTFTREPGLRPFRLGAFVIAAQLGQAVVPVALRGTRTILRGDQWFPRAGSVAVDVLPAATADGTDFSAAIRLRDLVRASIRVAYGEPDLPD